MKKSLTTPICAIFITLFTTSFSLTACGKNDLPTKDASSVAQGEASVSSEEPVDIGNANIDLLRRDTDIFSGDSAASTGEKMQDAITITNPEICHTICEELGLKETDSFTGEHLSKIHTVDFSLLRDEDAEWLPHINLSDSNLDFRNNKNITNLRILKGFQSLKEQDRVKCLWIGSRQENNEAITSLEGLEYLFGGDGTILDEFRIEKNAGMDISALKNIGLCRQIIVNLDFSELMTAWEQLSDIYDSNTNIGTIIMNIYAANQSDTVQILDYRLDSHAADVDKRIRERSSGF